MTSVAFTNESQQSNHKELAKRECKNVRLHEKQKQKQNPILPQSKSLLNFLEKTSVKFVQRFEVGENEIFQCFGHAILFTHGTLKPLQTKREGKLPSGWNAAGMTICCL